MNFIEQIVYAVLVVVGIIAMLISWFLGDI